LQKAAYLACTHANVVGLEPVPNYYACYEEAMGNAVRSAHQPQLTNVYLAVHTPSEAAIHRIEVPLRLATTE